MGNESTQTKQALATEDETNQATADAEESDELEIESLPVESEIELEALRAKLDEAVAKQEEYLEFCKRERADFENYKRRTRSEGLEQYDAGRMRIIEDILPVIDAMESAVASAKDELTKQGVQLVLKQMAALLEKWGVSVIDRPGEPFDPRIENAMLTGEAGEGSPGSVLAVLRKGYCMGSKLLRTAMVKVAMTAE